MQVVNEPDAVKDIVGIVAIEIAAIGIVVGFVTVVGGDAVSFGGQLTKELASNITHRRMQ